MNNNFLKLIGGVALINVVSRLLGFVRELIIGYHYGTSFLADSIITAYTIPMFFYIVVGGSITTAFISIYHKIADGEKRERFMTSLFTFILIIMVVTTVLLFVFADGLLALLFPGLSGEQFSITKELFYWMAPTTLILVLSIWLSGLLNVHKRFFLSNTSTLMNNLLIIVVAVALQPLFGVHAYGAGILAGAILGLYMLIRGVRTGKHATFALNFKFSPDLWRVLKMSIPLMIGGATLQFYFIIQRFFASQLEEGAIASLNYASKLTQFPQAVLITAVTTVIYPLMSQKVAENKLDDFKDLYSKGMRWLMLLLLPVTVFLYFYAKEIVILVFEYGNFDRQSSDMTAPLLQIFALSMFVLASGQYITRFFYALERSNMPVVLNVISVFGINVLVTIWLLENLGAEAVAWGTTISAIANYFLLILAAQFMLKLSITKDSKELMKLVVFLVSLTAILYSSARWISFSSTLLTFIVGGIVFVLGTFLLLKVLGFEEYNMLKKRVLRKKANA
ncbi:murein biosynthesis integral membrane protein MurJ [Bacillus sp. HMF5848]|uniref:murein biosynthesis integral membrane protein MurJ n=1 Tax=Bacillus sp. HMF5848 TaxID=2495421 RepID=UPI000F79BE80|nr:murein biosynthesis integral membrane protein MurJ [Bacillus sp. HMF5848]RSK28639.1 murein biosynthesis integral membrane protein MurJ [Bacillus sp. HMF5848]